MNRSRSMMHALALGCGVWVLAACGGRTADEPRPQGLPAPRPSAGFSTNIEEATLENDDFRRVIFTGQHSQLVLMTLQPGDELGSEVHPNTDQFIRVESGTGWIAMNGQSQQLEDGSAIVIPAGFTHNIVNNGTEPLRLYTVYSPPQHSPNMVQRTRQEADTMQRRR